MAGTAGPFGSTPDTEPAHGPLPPSRLSRAVREAAAVGLLAGVYYLAARLGLYAAAAHHVVSSLWPPAGIALFALLRFGPRLWPGVTLGAFLLNATSGVPVAGAAAIAVGNTLAAVVGALLLTRIAGFHRSMDRLRDVLALAGLAGIASTLISASNGAASLILSGAAPATSFLQLWQSWWSGDAVGVLVVAPFLLVWSEPEEPEPASVWRHLETALMFAVLAVGTDVLFRSGRGYAYAAFPLVTWIALRRGQRGAATAVAVVTLIASLNTVVGAGPFAGSTPLHNLFLLQVFLGLLSVSSLLFAAALAERSSVEAHLEQHARELSAAQQIARLGSWHWDMRRDVVTWSPELYRIYGVGAGEFRHTLEAFLERVHPDDRAGVQRAVERALAERSAFRLTERIIRPDGEIRFLATSGEIVTDASRTPVAMTGVCQDVTEPWLAEQALRASQARFAGIVDIADDAIISVDATQSIHLFNDGAEKIFGYAAEEVLGQPLDILLPSRFVEAHREHIHGFAQSADTARRMGERREIFGRRKDGTEFPAEASISKLQVGSQTVFTVILRDITERQQEQERRKQLRAQLIRAQEDERRRIARELHDEAGQSLTALQVGLSLIRKAKTASTVRRHARRMRDIVDRTLVDLGRLALGLHPRVLDDLGLEVAVMRYARDCATLHGFRIDVQTMGMDDKRLPPHIESAVYRIVIEALTNIARHSQATSVRILLRRAATSLEAIVEDDGQGFDVPTVLHDPDQPWALGLHSMRERAALVDGWVTIESWPAGGSKVALRVPLEGQAHP